MIYYDIISYNSNRSFCNSSWIFSYLWKTSTHDIYVYCIIYNIIKQQAIKYPKIAYYIHRSYHHIISHINFTHLPEPAPKAQCIHYIEEFWTVAVFVSLSLSVSVCVFFSFRFCYFFVFVFVFFQFFITLFVYGVEMQVDLRRID